MTETTKQRLQEATTQLAEALRTNIVAGHEYTKRATLRRVREAVDFPWTEAGLRLSAHEKEAEAEIFTTHVACIDALAAYDKAKQMDDLTEAVSASADARADYAAVMKQIEKVDVREQSAQKSVRTWDECVKLIHSREYTVALLCENDHQLTLEFGHRSSSRSTRAEVAPDLVWAALTTLTTGIACDREKRAVTLACASCATDGARHREGAPSPYCVRCFNHVTLTHELKTWPAQFQATYDGVKLFDVRRDDRGYALGDILHLREWERERGWADIPSGFGFMGEAEIPGVPARDAYTGREQKRRITYILRGADAHAFGLQEGYCVLGLGPEVTGPCSFVDHG
jgi:hypothetical protein